MTAIEPISEEDALAVHSAAIRKFGGLDGVRDWELLRSALAQPHQTFDGVDLYPDTVAKACRYAFGIIRDHPFLDGNKRVGTALLGAYLRKCGFTFMPRSEELLYTMLRVAEGELGFEELIEWVRLNVS